VSIVRPRRAARQTRPVTTTGAPRTEADLRELGRAARERVPHADHADLVLPPRSPFAILQAQNATREPDLVALRMERMLVDAFAFFRGTAALMATDLRTTASTGFRVLADGDAHLQNFGLFASPERTLVFDLNDFDEAGWAPWEWDLKRLATSATLAALAHGADVAAAEEAAVVTAEGYREAVRALAGLSVLERYYVRADLDDLRGPLGARAAAALDRTVQKARRRTSLRAAERLTAVQPDGSRRFVDDPPVLEHREDSEAGHTDRLLDTYLDTLDPDVRALLSRFRVDDVARKVVGVGSVGTRCYLLVLRGPADEPLLLQIKQAGPSVLESHGGQEQPGLGEPGARDREGRRVMAHQRILQAVTDPFLGHFSGRSHDYYVRQYHDMKGSIDLRRFSIDEIRAYVRTCGTLLARAHAQSEHVTSIAAYLDDSHEFDRAVGAWSLAYAAQMAEDHAAVLEAVGG
jgi:uncharacterized protein (DUF2252 family)